MFMNIDLFNLKRELDYFCNYYGSDFLCGFGTEEILECFNKYFVKSKWLDLGGGSTSLLWWLAQKYNNPIDIVDISEESFFLTKILKLSNYDGGCYKYVRSNYYNRDLRHCKTKFIKRDLLSNISLKHKYKNISQIGLLGLCSNEKQFEKILAQICGLLKENGILISANWIFNEQYSIKKNIDNTFLNQQLIQKFVKENNLTLKYCKYVNFINDDNYKGVIIYVIQRKKNLAKSC